jgi:hypothetical protein
MAITGTAIEQYDDRIMKEGQDGQRSFTRGWKIELDLSAATEGEIDAIEKHVEALVPVARYAGHPSDGACFARELELRPESLSIWKATVTYGSFQAPARTPIDALPAGEGGEPPKPDRKQDKSTPANERYPEISYARVQRSKPLEKDATNGVPVENTAGDPYDPPIEVERSKYQIQIRWWAMVEGFDFESHMQFMDKVNEEPITILGIEYPAFTLRVVDLAPKPIWDVIETEISEQTVRLVSLVWELNATLEYDPDTHKIEVLNAGKRELIGGRLWAIGDGTGSTVSDPVPLGEDGAILLPSAEKVYQVWNGYVPMDLNDLFNPPEDP